MVAGGKLVAEGALVVEGVLYVSTGSRGIEHWQQS